MGYATANDLASTVDLSTGVSIHLSSNCYPPIPQIMVPGAVEAIEACARGEQDTLIELPVGVESATYGKEPPAWQWVDELRLDAFVDALFDEGEW